MAVDLRTTYMGIPLRNPLVVAPCPLSENSDMLEQMEEAGAGAVVIHSLFEEQLLAEELGLEKNLTQGTESFPEALSYFPELPEFRLGSEEYLELLRKAKKALTIPVIGSLNGISPGGWLRYAKAIEENGADGLELNIYYIPTDPETTGEDVEKKYIDLVQEVKNHVRIPVAVKIGPFFSSLPNMAKQFDQAGANALVLFNRFYQPDIDLEALEVVPDLNLSNASTLRRRLRWAAILFGRIQADLAITGGVHTGEDVIKAVLVGAKVVMMASVLLKKGIPYISTLVDDIAEWLQNHEYDSIGQIHGLMSHRTVANPSAFERANYMKVLGSWKWSTEQ